MIIGYMVLPCILIFLIFLFGKEKDNKKEYIKKILILNAIMHICTFVCIPFYGNLFGVSSILASSLILASYIEFKA